MSYSYKPDGLRLSKTVNGVRTGFVWDNGNIIETTDGNGNPTGIYKYGLGRVSDNKGNYYIYNAHGDVMGLTDSAGNVVREYEYDAFGMEVSKDKNDTNPFRYCGEYYDNETESIYLRARNYDPGIGRFTSEDPHWTVDNMIYGDKDTKIPDIKSIMQSNNRYVYCINNPIKFVDFNGEWLNETIKLNVRFQDGRNQVILNVIKTVGSWGIFSTDFDVMITLYQDNKFVTSICSKKYPINLSASTNGKTSYWKAKITGLYGDQYVNYDTYSVLFNKRGERYPTYIDPKSKKFISEPKTNLKIVPMDKRVKWTNTERNEYRKWYENTYNGGNSMDWSNLEIHHIIPRQYGGTNDKNNLIVLPKQKHKEVTRWWTGY